jgi:hypothetical protein
MGCVVAGKTIQDQDGARWLVLKDDPAGLIVALLRRTRTVLVLPRITITQAVVPLPSTVEVHMQRLGTALQFTDDPVVLEAYKRAVILYECLAELAQSMR